MAKPAHVKATFSGNVGGTAGRIEDWSFSLNFPDDIVSEASTQAGIAGQAADLAAAWHNALEYSMPSDVVLTKVRIAHIGADGKVTLRADGSYLQADWDGAFAGNQAQQPMPLQTALCVSLISARSGPTGKGRIFLPWPALSLDADDKRIPVAQLTPFLGYVRTFLSNVAGIMTEDPRVVSSKGYASPVTTVKIGRVADTMRSRRGDMTEGYLSTPLHP